MDDMSYNVRVPKRWARLAMIVGVAALIVAPLTAVASHVFDDVPNSHTFHNDITWLAASGVTKGCNPPTNTEFCPDDNVTRGQMAAFQRRFAQYLDAEDGTPAQADNADTVDGFDAGALMSHATGVSRDGQNGGNVLNLPLGTSEELATLQLSSDSGPFALVTYSLYIGAGSDADIQTWLQTDSTTCDRDLRIPGTLTTDHIDVNFMSLGSSTVLHTTGSPVLSYCAQAFIAAVGVRDFQFNVIHVSDGATPVVVTGDGTDQGQEDLG